MVELVDTLCSGRSVLTGVGVQIPPSAQKLRGSVVNASGPFCLPVQMNSQVSTMSTPGAPQLAVGFSVPDIDISVADMDRV